MTQTNASPNFTERYWQTIPKLGKPIRMNVLYTLLY